MNGKRPTVSSLHGVVAAAHPLAAQAGARLLADGGNAFDAAAATAAALNVVEPYMSGLAGMGMAICFVAAERRVRTLDFVTRVPSRFSTERFRARADLARGPLATGTPGNLAGWCELVWAHGKKPLADVLAPAIRLASDGFPLVEFNVDGINEVAIELRAHPAFCEDWARNYLGGAGEMRRGAPHGFWFNKALMKKAGLDPSQPPQTIAALDHDMGIIKAKLPNVHPFAMMTAKGAYAVVNMWPWLQAYCKTPPMTADRLGWTQPCAVQAFTWFQMMAKKGWMPIGTNMKDNRQLFATNQVAFTIDGPYMRGIVGSINAAYAANAAFADTFGAGKVPVGPSGVSRTAIDIHQIAISAHSAHPDAAWKFVQFMVGSAADMRDFIIPEGGMPPLVSLQKQFSKSLDQPYQQVWITDIIPEARPIPYTPNWFHASDSIVNALEKVVNGGDVKSALQELEKQLKRLFPHYQT